jgi:hypothetical protein
VKEYKSRYTDMMVKDNLNKVGKFCNTSFPLMSDIRSLSIHEQPHDLFLSLFNIRTRKSEEGGSKIVLRGGPNGRQNRYLKYQYNRLLN